MNGQSTLLEEKSGEGQTDIIDINFVNRRLPVCCKKGFKTGEQIKENILNYQSLSPKVHIEDELASLRTDK